MGIQSIVAFLFLLPISSFAQTQYVVRQGDTVLKIADKTLGITDKKNPRRYQLAKKIRGLNPNIKDLNLLEPGQTLILPAADKPVFTKVEKPIHTPEPVLEAIKAPVVETAPPPAPPVTEPLPIVALPETHAITRHEEETHPNFIFVQPRYQMVNLETKDLATETEAKLKSKSSFGIDLQYGKIVNDRFHILFQAGFTQTEFKDIEGDAISVNHQLETTKSFGVGVAYEATHTLHLDFMVLYADRTFLLPEGLLAYKLESVGIPGAELNISWDLYSGSANIFGISAIAEYVGNYSKDEVDYKSALEPVGALYWKSNNGHDHTNYKATLTYKHGEQKTNISEQKEELAVLGVGFYF